MHCRPLYVVIACAGRASVEMHLGWADEGSETAGGVHFLVILAVCGIRSGEVTPPVISHSTKFSTFINRPIIMDAI
jgi:hypothetical protein